MERVRLQPFPLVSHARAAVYLGRLLDRRQLALQELANLPTTRLLDLDAGAAESMLMNVNTLADYHALCDAFGMDVSVIGGR
ncbi:MAG: hypothetical protein HYZ89_08575 [Candidatus Omnitrophica bacterium]|nr:hypothetical protein [Candidatus Omnitrophota bacterium]